MHTRVAHLLDPATQATPWPGLPGNAQPNSADKRLGDGSYGDAALASALDGVPATANAGSDFMWSSNAIFRPERGSWFQSNIAHIRYFNLGFSAASGGALGPTPQMLQVENDLLWAEALIRGGGDLNLAAAKINNTRVTRGGLTAATGADDDPSARSSHIEPSETVGPRPFDRCLHDASRG